MSEFPGKCNQESVALEGIEFLEDVQFLQSTIQEFVQKTGSVMGQHILDNWANEKQYFVKVRDEHIKLFIEQSPVHLSKLEAFEDTK